MMSSNQSSGQGKWVAAAAAIEQCWPDADQESSWIDAVARAVGVNVFLAESCADWWNRFCNSQKRVREITSTKTVAPGNKSLFTAHYQNLEIVSNTKKQFDHQTKISSTWLNSVSNHCSSTTDPGNFSTFSTNGGLLLQKSSPASSPIRSSGSVHSEFVPLDLCSDAGSGQSSQSSVFLEYTEDDEKATFLEQQRSVLRETRLESGLILEDEVHKVALNTEEPTALHSYIVDLDGDFASFLCMEDQLQLEELWKRGRPSRSVNSFPWISERLIVSSTYLSAEFMQLPEELRSNPDLVKTFALLDTLDEIFASNESKAYALSEIEKYLLMTPILDENEIENREKYHYYIKMRRILTDFVTDWDGMVKLAKQEGNFMRVWNNVFDTLRPIGVHTTPPETSVEASKERKLENPEQSTNVRAKKADKLWQTIGKVVLAWLESKPTNMIEKPAEAKSACLKTLKGTKDCLDAITKRYGKNVEIFGSVNLGLDWTLKSSIRIPSGLIMSGEVFTVEFPEYKLQFDKFTKVCRASILWAVALQRGAKTIEGFVPVAKRKIPKMVSTAASPKKPRKEAKDRVNSSNAKRTAKDVGTEY